MSYPVRTIGGMGGTQEPWDPSDFVVPPIPGLTAPPLQAPGQIPPVAPGTVPIPTLPAAPSASSSSSSVNVLAIIGAAVGGLIVGGVAGYFIGKR